MNEHKKCLFCNAILIGRIDKKFCDAHCRNNFNNRTKQKREKQILEINKTLRKNRSILRQLSPTGKTTVRKEYLLKLDFNFKYCTHNYTTSHGNTYTYCYEYGYLEIEEGMKILIVSNY